MDIKIQIQSTPNPNALKFVLNTTVKTEGKVSYKAAEECGENTLAKTLFGISNVTEIFFFDNYITITQDGNGDWDDIEEKVTAMIKENIEKHNPDFKVAEPEKATPTADMNNPEINKINSILDQTIRPALQMDGGDLTVISYTDNVLSVNYQGACGSCPSSAMGTLKAIENILKDEFNPQVTVQIAE